MNAEKYPFGSGSSAKEEFGFPSLAWNSIAAVFERGAQTRK